MTASGVAGRLVIAGVAFMLAGCGISLLSSQRVEYKSAGKLPPLEVPPDLTAPARDERYQVPDLAPGGSEAKPTANAERAGGGQLKGSGTVLRDMGRLRVERSGDERWLVVPVPPERLWPEVKEFWQEIGFVLKAETPDAGVMETEWAENRAKVPRDFISKTIGRFIDVYSTGERDKFRTRLDRGAEPGTTEVYITHRGMEEVYIKADPLAAGDRSTRWQPRASDPELEVEFLRRLMIRLGVEEGRARAQLDGAPRTERAKLVASQEGAGLLQLEEPFDGAWRRVGLALDRIGFTVEDRDRSRGVYFVDYADPEADAVTVAKQDGLLSKFLFWRSGKSESKNEQYRILVRDNRQSCQIQVLDREGAGEPVDASRRILSLLQQQLR
jgi:outer membrane protein assembly factor BamC